MNINESSLREYVNNVVKRIFENRDIFDALDNQVTDHNAKAKKYRQNSNTVNFNKPKPTQPALVANPTVNKPKPNPALIRNTKNTKMNTLRR
jgi:hypothetical protein